MSIQGLKLTEIFPTIPKVKRLLVLRPNLARQETDFWIWLRAFQGLINRKEPHLYLICSSYGEKRSGEPSSLYEEHWLDYYVKRFLLPVESLKDVDELIDLYKREIDGYVIYDNEKLIQTQNIAITLAGLERLLPIAPDQEHWMIKHGIPKREDLRDKFNDNWDAAEWAIKNLWPLCNKKIYANFCIHRPSWYSRCIELVDYIVYSKAFALDLPVSRVHRRTLKLYRRMLESADIPGVQMNWHCVWDQEKDYVAEGARHGFFTLCSVYTPNLTIHGGIGDSDKSYTQSLPKKETCIAKKEKIYVCLYMSDGDATWAMNNLHSGNWLAPQRGNFKFNWGFLPLMVKLMPGMLQYYQETRTDNDCFWGPSSGAGYTYSHLWPKDLVDLYLRESRILLNQSGQNGCNMVNWNLLEWWREVEDLEAVRREQKILKDGPGLVCGLGGSPYAKSYLEGPIPKLHSVHIARVGHDNIGDIVRFSKECPTRPLFMFLFAQIAEGLVEHLASEMNKLNEYPEIELLTMDEFFLTLQDALKRGLIKDELYEKTEALAETWLKAPGRHRLPLCLRLIEEFVRIIRTEPIERRRYLSEAGWTDLASMEVERVAINREDFLTRFKGRTPPSEEEEADTLLYVAFYLAWAIIRASILSQGIYANSKDQCLKEFKRICGHLVDTSPFEKLFEAWDKWEEGVPSIEEITPLCDAIALQTRMLVEKLGPRKGEKFIDWPSPEI